MANLNPIEKATIDTFKYNSDQVDAFLKVCGQRTEGNIKTLLDKDYQNIHAQTLADAIAYSTFGGGKRIRPGLVYATADLFGLEHTIVDPIACAVELIHCYSLIHDDLPSMDDDDVRRGKPSCHRQFNEAVAILAGDAMQALAFECLSKASSINAESKNEICYLLANTAGVSGMAGGQAMDILSNTEHASKIDIEKIHLLKTGALIKACILMVITCVPKVDPTIRKKLNFYADHIGLCFQIQDDLLDSQETDDNQQEKISYVAIHGKDAAIQRLNELSKECLNSLSSLGKQAKMLTNITHYIVHRNS